LSILFYTSITYLDNDISESRSKNDNTEIVLNQVVKDNIKVNTSIAQESIADKTDTVDDKNTQGIKKKKKTNNKRKMAAKFPSPFGSGNFSSLDWYFSQITLPNMIYLYIFIQQNVVFTILFYTPPKHDISV
jgi:hypothetical protein